MFFFLCKNANLESTCAVFAISSRYVASRHVTSHRIASHHISSQRGWNASGGGSATSVAARCSKTGPLRMRASSLLHRASGAGRGRCRLLIPTCPTCRPGGRRVSRARAFDVWRCLPALRVRYRRSLFFSLSLTYTLSPVPLPLPRSPREFSNASLPLDVIIVTRLLP